MSEELRYGALRRDYGGKVLRRADLLDDPIAQFVLWFDAARRAGECEANAFALATATPDGRPSVRMVLMKHCDGGGLFFFSNYDSRKGRELLANRQAAACFWWAQSERQVRWEGHVERLDDDVNDAYFAQRPRVSQLAAASSPQSQPVADRAELERRLRQVSDSYATGQPVDRPSFWGGWRLVPQSIEFWQGGAARLHDRFLYRREGDGWQLTRLAP